MNRINYRKTTSTLHFHKNTFQAPKFLLFHGIWVLILVLRLRGAERLEDSVRTLWLNASWLLAVNSPPSPLGWPLLWTYEPCRSARRGETVRGLLIKYYSPLNGWRLASVGMLGLNLPPGQMCECVCVCEERQCRGVCWREGESREGRGCCTCAPHCKWIAYSLGGGCSAVLRGECCQAALRCEQVHRLRPLT